MESLTGSRPGDWERPEVVGFSPLSADALLELVLREEPASAPGDFVLRARHRDGERELLATSAVSARPYYLAGTVHGPDLYDVARRAGAPWRWNLRAVRAIAVLEHAVGADTLHADVERVPANAVCVLGRGGARMRRGPFWARVFDGPPSTAAATTAAFRAAADDAIPDGSVISVSGGFDSRAIVAAAVALGRS